MSNLTEQEKQELESCGWKMEMVDYQNKEREIWTYTIEESEYIIFALRQDLPVTYELRRFSLQFHREIREDRRHCLRRTVSNSIGGADSVDEATNFAISHYIHLQELQAQLRDIHASLSHSCDQDIPLTHLVKFLPKK